MSPNRRALPLLLAAIIAVGALGAGAAPARAETLADLFRDANARFWEGDFETARGLYHHIVEDYRIDNPEVYFNLANTYGKLDRLGSAVLYYERALASDPGPDTKEAAAANLAQVRQMLAARHREDVGRNRMLFDDSHGAWYALFHLLPADSFAILLAIVWMGLAAALVVRRTTRSQGLRRGLKPTAVALLVLVVLAGGLLAGNVATTRTIRLGVVIQADVKLRATRVPDAPSVGLPEGLEVRILSEDDGAAEGDGEWTRVLLSNGREGFVPADAVKEI